MQSRDSWYLSWPTLNNKPAVTTKRLHSWYCGSTKNYVHSFGISIISCIIFSTYLSYYILHIWKSEKWSPWMPDIIVSLTYSLNLSPPFLSPFCCLSLPTLSYPSCFLSPPTLSVSQPVIHCNLVSSMRVIVTNMTRLGIPFSSPVNRVSRVVSVNIKWRPNKVVLVTLGFGKQVLLATQWVGYISMIA